MLQPPVGVARGAVARPSVHLATDSGGGMKIGVLLSRAVGWVLVF